MVTPGAMADEDAESVRTPESLELAALPLPQLEALVQETSHALSLLKVETEIFEKYYNKMEPKELVSHLLPDIQGSSLDLAQPRVRRKSKSRAAADRFLGLTVEQKNDLAQRELDETKEEIQQSKRDSERIIQNYQAVMEEAAIRWADIKKAMCNFNKDIIQTISKKKGSVVACEKVLRYLEEKNHNRDAMKEKLRLKNDSLKVQKKKLQLQLKQKEEMGEALHEVDFQQLKIENAQFLEKIDERNRDLLQLKLTVGNTLQILNSYKLPGNTVLECVQHRFDPEAGMYKTNKQKEAESRKGQSKINKSLGVRKLQNATAASARLLKDISQRKEALEKVERETVLVEEERAKAESVNKQLRQKLSDYRVPPVMKYVNQKMAIYDLENSIKIWERKVEIAEVQ